MARFQVKAVLDPERQLESYVIVDMAKERRDFTIYLYRSHAEEKALALSNRYERRQSNRATVEALERAWALGEEV